MPGRANAPTFLCGANYPNSIVIERKGEFITIRSAIGLAAALDVARCIGLRHLMFSGIREASETEVIAEGPPAIVRVKLARPTGQ